TADTGPVEKVRCLPRTGSEACFAPATRFPGLAALQISDPDGSLVVQQDACGESFGFDAQIGALARWIEKSAGRRPTPAVFLRRLIISEAVLVAAVVVGIAGEPFSDGGLDKRVANLGVLAQRGDIEGAAATPRVPAVARFVVLGFFEVWQNSLIRPAAVAEL